MHVIMRINKKLARTNYLSIIHIKIFKKCFKIYVIEIRGMTWKGGDALITLKHDQCNKYRNGGKCQCHVTCPGGTLL